MWWWAADGITRPHRINEPSRASRNGPIMGNRNLHFTGAWLISIILCLSQGAASQDKERPKLKNFGSSLNKTKPDAKKTPESKPKSNSKSENADIDVV